MLDAVYESGCTTWDTADVYGDSEELIGKWCVCTPSLTYVATLNTQNRFKRTGKRGEIFLATKFGAGSPSGKVIDCSPAYVKEALNNSLAKLGVDHIDLYYAHR